LKAREIRASFLDFFAKKHHEVVVSSTLVPQDDPTLMFTNAGMNQFKGVFLGLEKRDYVRAASVQKCMRVSGKHNDLEEVGKDARHHTFFEMLGNWSFGDYYKSESIAWGWKFLVDEMKLDASRLWVSVYKDDDESFGIWENEIGIAPERIVRLGDLEKGDDENFWSMADTGPCGPCTEIHYDQGESMKCDHVDGCFVGVCDCDRWLELWNHVFMEFDRQEDGELKPLPMKSVDTGLGFERLVAVMQGKQSNYETDIFTPLIKRMAEISGRTAEGEDRISMQVIADHARAVAFTVADGAIPSSSDSGYVVRRILRRAVRHGHLLGVEEPFLYRISALVIDDMADAYPELAERRERILDVIKKEEERFLRTLDSGLQVYADFKDVLNTEGRTQLSGEEAFKLHDTFGFPVDLTGVVAAEDGFTVDMEGFAVCMEQQRVQSRRENKFMAGIKPWETVAPGVDLGSFKSEFKGYETLTASANVVAVRAAGQDESGDDLSHLLFDVTPFYAESGGQVGDRGSIVAVNSGLNRPVLDTLASAEGAVCAVVGKADELVLEFKKSAAVSLAVDEQLRAGVMRNHTATHLLQAALRSTLGDHVEQAGSVVEPGRLRFDFRHDQAVTTAQLATIEKRVCESIAANRAVLTEQDVAIKDAKARGAMALFGEKYGDKVRVVQIHDGPRISAEQAEDFGPVYSVELCGGTHSFRTGDIGAFRITSEGSVSSGVRRIEAVTGPEATALFQNDRDQVLQLTKILRQGGGNVVAQAEALVSERDELKRELMNLQQDSARASLSSALDTPREVAGLRVISAQVEAENKDAFMQLGDHVRDKLGSQGVVVLTTEINGKATLLVTVTSDLTESKSLHAGNLVKVIAEAGGGRGGGRPNMAQAGMPDAEGLAKALAAADQIIADQLAN
jgi:alanyl-tRNA synthetase